MSGRISIRVVGVFVLWWLGGHTTATAQTSAPSTPTLPVKVLVKLEINDDEPDFHSVQGVIAVRRPHWAPLFAVVDFEHTRAAGLQLATLKELPGVKSVKKLSASRRKSRSLSINDPLAAFDSAQPGYQWHLKNSGKNGASVEVDLNVESAWQSFQGSGVVIGILDDAVEITHPDIALNAALDLHFDWLDDTENDPEGGRFEEHGTACAGLAAGRGDNGIGIAGVAPLASIAGLRMLGDVIDDEIEGAALAHAADAIHVKSNSWGPPDDDTTPEGPAELAAAALGYGAHNGRGGLGTVYVWAAGNGRTDGDLASLDGYANSIYTITVGSITDKGEITDYGEVSTAVLISAPSDGGIQEVTTTDLTGSSGENSGFSAGNYSNADYRNDFGGTSASAPMIAGTIALILEANPTLSWRDVQEIVLRSGRRIQPDDHGWEQNGAGFSFHPAIGTGLMDTTAAVDLAQSWVPLPPAFSRVFAAPAELETTIPDNDTTGLSVPFAFQNDAPHLRVEHVTVEVSIAHLSKSDLRIDLVSPFGTVSPLVASHRRIGGDSNRNYNWKFMSVFHWGESTAGEWKLVIADEKSGTVGTLQALTVTAHGAPSATSPTNYGTWKLLHFNDGKNDAPEDDPDRDGLQNLIEYALSTDPLSGNQSIPGPLEFQKNPSLADLSCFPEFSLDLETWQQSESELLKINLEGKETHRFLPPAGAMDGYFRLRIELLP